MKRRYTSFHRSELLLTPQEDEERYKTKGMIRSLERMIGNSMTDDEKRRAKNERDRRRREKKKLLANPVKCRECKIVGTCLKRKAYKLTQCAYGFRKG